MDTDNKDYKVEGNHNQLPLFEPIIHRMKVLTTMSNKSNNDKN